MGAGGGRRGYCLDAGALDEVPEGDRAGAVAGDEAGAVPGDGHARDHAIIAL